MALQFVADPQLYRAGSAQTAAIQQTFVQTLATSADSYTAAEAANVSSAG